MPHSIRNFFLNSTLASENYAQNSHHNTTVPSSAFEVNTSIRESVDSESSRRYSSSFNTTYNVNPSSLPSYAYTDRFLHRTPPLGSTSPTGLTLSRQGQAPRMSQHPPSQRQHYADIASAATTNLNSRSYIGTGYSSAYQGGGNSGPYHASYSSHYVPSNIRGSNNGNGTGTHSKIVCRMDCRYCAAVICLRGMKAMLLADTTVELFSTDHPPGSVQLIDKDYTTSNCACKIRDVACRVCGNVVGYHITQPCQQCLKAPNNGHFWMFHTEGVIGQERLTMDLGKLVQELVSHSRPGEESSLDSSIDRNLTTALETLELESSETATFRLASVARASRQQRPAQRRRPLPPLLSPSPSAVSETRSNLGKVEPIKRPAPIALEFLLKSQVLQPMRWDQLPCPELDIDLDPTAIGGEPLFAGQWIDLVTKTAEAAAANMSLALYQEEETERYLEEIEKESTRQSRLLDDHNTADETTSPDALGLLADRSYAQGGNIEQLIDQLDDFGLRTPPRTNNDGKDVEIEDGMTEALDNWTADGRQQHNAQPNIAPAPGQEEALLGVPRGRTSRQCSTDDLQQRVQHRHPAMQSADGTASVSAETYPAFALTSAVIARAAASAAAADAASAANNLLYGRRTRRDYDMMCR
ncbi:Protein fam72a [Mortierella claussenii]|nr:Protein fam72a [Mortierella claussenii]